MKTASTASATSSWATTASAPPSVRYLSSNYTLPPDTTLEDLGTPSLGLPAYLASYDRVIFIDAVALDAPPGTVRVFSNCVISCGGTSIAVDDEIGPSLLRKSWGLWIHASSYCECRARDRLSVTPQPSRTVSGVPATQPLDFEWARGGVGKCHELTLLRGMPVFGRDYVGHPLAQAIEEMATHSTPAVRALSRNFAHDHRVTEARDETLRRRGEDPWTPTVLQKAVVRYQYEQVRTRRLPDFVYRAANEPNIVAGDGRICRFNRGVPLARVLDLNGLITVYQWARSRGFEPFARWTPWPVTDEEIARRLDATLNGALPEEIGDFTDAALQALTSYAEAHAYQPAWCTTWADFEPYIDQGADRWLEALGIASKGIGRWILLLKYPIRAAGTVVRPTQLDVGWDARGHFPSPPDAPIWRGGHAMDLAGHNTLKRLLPEYIHRQIPHTLKHWHDAGRRLGVTTRHARSELVKARTSHHALLAFHYGAPVYDWMPRAI